MSLLARGKSILFIGGLIFFVIGVSTASVFSINLGGGSSGDNSGILDRARTNPKGSEVPAVDNENEDLNKDKDSSYSEPNIDVNESFEEYVSGEASVDEEQNPENMSSSSRLINDDGILENQKDGEASTKDQNDDDRETIGAVPEDNHIEKEESIPEDNEEEQSQTETGEFSQEDFISGFDNALSEFLNGGSIDTFVQDIMSIVGNFMQGLFGQGSILGIEESVEPQEIPSLPDAVEPPQKTEEDKDSEQSDDDESDDIDDGQGAGATKLEGDAEEGQAEEGEEEVVVEEEEEGEVEEEVVVGGEETEEDEEQLEEEEEQEGETYGDPNRTDFDLNNAETVEERKDILRDAALTAGMSESQARLFVAGAMVESSSLAFNRYDPHGADMNNESGKYGTDAQCFLPGNISIHMLRESGVDLSRDELLYISEHDAKRAAELSKQVMEHYDLVGDFSKDEALSSDYMHDIRNGYDSVARGIGEADDAFVGTYDIAWDGFDAPGRVAGSAPGQ